MAKALKGAAPDGRAQIYMDSEDGKRWLQQAWINQKTIHRSSGINLDTLRDGRKVSPQYGFYGGNIKTHISL